MPLEKLFWKDTFQLYGMLSIISHFSLLKLICFFFADFFHQNVSNDRIRAVKYGLN